MKTLDLKIVNPSPILRALQRELMEAQRSDSIYLKMPLQRDYANPLNLTHNTNALGMAEFILPEILYAFGIRSLILKESYELSAFIELGNEILWNKETKLSDSMDDPAFTDQLLELFSKCKTIAFDDWTDFSEALQLWPKLLSQIFLHLEDKQLEYIFYLGDASRKDRFNINNALDIMTGFSGTGNVTLALDELEAFNLWKQLNGVGSEFTLASQTIGELRMKYFAVYHMIGVSRLLIYSTNSAILLSDQEQFILSRKVVDSRIEFGNNARLNFITGYSAGLLYAESLAHSIALGLIIFAACGEYESLPDTASVQAYISEWVADLDKPESIYLYQ